MVTAEQVLEKCRLQRRRKCLRALQKLRCALLTEIHKPGPQNSRCLCSFYPRLPASAASLGLRFASLRCGVLLIFGRAEVWRRKAGSHE